MDDNDLTGGVIGAAIEVHRVLGPGLLESAYHQCLAHELDLRGIRYESEVLVPIRYKDHIVGQAYRLDLLVEGSLVVELKAVDKITALHKVQVVTYLRLTGRRLGLLINFHTPVLKAGVHRISL